MPMPRPPCPRAESVRRALLALGAAACVALVLGYRRDDIAGARWSPLDRSLGVALVALVALSAASWWSWRAQRRATAALRTQYEHFPLPTVTWRAVGGALVLVAYNAAQQALVRGQMATMVGKRVGEVYRDRPDIVADHARCLAERATIRREYDYQLRMIGEERRLAVTYVFVPPDLVMVHGEDLTARHAAEAALRQSAESFSDLFEATAEATIITEGGRIAAINRAYTALTGYAPEEVLGHIGVDFVAPAERAMVEAQMQAGHERPYEVQHRHRDGSVFPVELLGRAIRYRGRPARLTTLRDIAARRADEAALRSSELRYRALHASAERQARERLLLYQVQTALARELDPDAVVRIVVEAIAATFGYTQVSLYLREGGEHVLQHQVGYDHALARIPATAGVSGRAIAEGRALLVADVATDPAFLGAIDGVTSEICVPLSDAERPAGFLNVESVGGVRLGEDDLRLMAALGEQVGIALGRARLHRELREREAHLAHQAFHDALTGLPNRALFLDRLDRALARGRRDEDATCAVLFLDLDRFKQVNDSLGHAAGDQLLVAVTTLLRACLRDTDTLARFGGDEFALLLEDVGDLAGALRVAERLLAALQAPLLVAGREIVVTTSAGIALHTGAGDTSADLLRFADVALYRAKEAGRGRCEAFYPDMDGAALARLELEHDLRGALARDELRVRYQPMVDLATGRVAAVEALVRWQHPARGLVSPGDFILLAEETGLIVPLGRWVLTEACRQLCDWQAARPGSPAPTLTVNLSARQFRHPALVANVAAALAASGLAADRLALEVTETVAMERIGETLVTLGALKGLGVRLILDDFGTGHSSLAYLQRLPLDMLKIDRSFLHDTDENRAIVRAVADLAHGLGLGVTAEGLETADQVAWARATGCEWGQGFYFARPLPPEEFAALWAAGPTFTLPAAGSIPPLAAARPCRVLATPIPSTAG
jgi:diguanylate cyclase (GGDEF)-like protein/PAS domain S-box-containing protein